MQNMFHSRPYLITLIRKIVERIKYHNPNYLNEVRQGHWGSCTQLNLPSWHVTGRPSFRSRHTINISSSQLARRLGHISTIQPITSTRPHFVQFQLLTVKNRSEVFAETIQVHYYCTDTREREREIERGTKLQLKHKFLRWREVQLSVINWHDAFHVSQSVLLTPLLLTVMPLDRLTLASNNIISHIHEKLTKTNTWKVQSDVARQKGDDSSRHRNWCSAIIMSWYSSVAGSTKHVSFVQMQSFLLFSKENSSNQPITFRAAATFVDDFQRSTTH